MIILDTREQKLIDLIKSTSSFSIPYTLENLLIGDILIKYVHNNITYSIILERKCVPDMIASIKDGRYKEQKIRLQAEIAKNSSISQTLICYILEGSQNELRLPQDKTMFNGSIISSIFRDKIPIIRTYTLQETLDIISRIHERLIKDHTDFSPQTIHTITQQSIQEPTDIIQVNNAYLTSIKKCKKDNITPQLWNQQCYMNIPGISAQIAIKISEVYPTIKSLYEAYEKCTSIEEKELLVANIILTETDKQKRRIGNVISTRLYQYLNV